MRLLTLRIACLALLFTVQSISPLYAHHSTLAQSTSERVTVQGTITRVEWVNPHVVIYIDVKDSVSGQVVKWWIEADSVAVLQTKGVRKEYLRIGASITATGAARRGSTLKLEVPDPDSSWKN